MDRAENVRQPLPLFDWCRHRHAAAAGASLLEASARLREPSPKLGMPDMRLRLGRQSAPDLVHVAARLRDHVIEIDREVGGMNRQELPSATALLVGGPVG